MLLVSWNVAGRVKRLEEQIACVLALEADLVYLQEITPTTLSLWRARLESAGYPSVEHAGPEGTATRRRPLMVLSASRKELTRLTVDGLPWPERVLAARLPDGSPGTDSWHPTEDATDLAIA